MNLSCHLHEGAGGGKMQTIYQFDTIKGYKYKIKFITITVDNCFMSEKCLDYVVATKAHQPGLFQLSGSSLVW